MHVNKARVTGHAYAWDVLGDPHFPERVHATGIPTVVLAASYHTARAATPLHPSHRLVDAHHAALYRPVRPSVWTGRLVPRFASWCGVPDPFAAAAAELRAGGLGVEAWIVLTHASHLGHAHPDVAVVNCFGDRYAHALCPAQPEVRVYAATLAAEAVRDVALDGVSVEACGQLGVQHGSHHEKTDGAFSPEVARLLSICCCPACRREWRARGLDATEVITTLRTAVRTGSPVPGLDVVLAARQAAADALRAEVLAAIRAEAGTVRVTLHGTPDPWATGASPGLTPTAADDVDAVLVPAWSTAPSTASSVAATRASSVGAYVTVLPPVTAETLDAHVRQLSEVADELHLYHLGLAGADRQPLLTRAVEIFTKENA